VSPRGGAGAAVIGNAQALQARQLPDGTLHPH